MSTWSQQSVTIIVLRYSVDAAITSLIANIKVTLCQLLG